MADVSTRAAEAQMNVCLLHNYRENQQFSMKIYADQLGRALEATHVAVSHVRPPELLSERWRSIWLADKVESYVGRFLYYPTIASAAPAADVYHIVDHGHAYLLNWLDARRTVVTCHDLMLLVLESGRLGRRRTTSVAALETFRAIVKFLIRAAVLVADSAQTRHDLIEFLQIDPARIEVIFPGMNQPFAPNAAARREGRRRWGLDGQLVVAQIGNAFYKNVETCLRVTALLRRRGVPVILLRGGKWMSPGDRSCAESLGIMGYVRETGPLADSDLPTFYNTADTLLFPSLYEGFGWPPLEAMACGIPVVCSRAGALAEVAGPAALTADPEDVEGLADHVASLLTDTSVSSRFRELGMIHAAQFDWASTAAKLVSVYQRVCRER